MCVMDESNAHPADAAPQPTDDSICWVCGGPTEERHCKIICLKCGFTRDCGDP